MWYALETINWLAKLQRTNDILTVTSALSNLYKISLIKREDLIILTPIKQSSTTSRQIMVNL